MMKFPKSFDSYNSRYYGDINVPTTPSKESLDKLDLSRMKLSSISHLNPNFSKEVNRIMRDVTGYSDMMIKRLTSASDNLYVRILKSILL